MRSFGLLLLAALALGCAHRAPSNGGNGVVLPDRQPPQPGDGAVPVRHARDLVGRYRDVGSRSRDLVTTITADSGVLVMTFPSTAGHELVIRGDGTFANWPSMHLFRRGSRTLLSLQWCYMYRLLERID